MNRQRTGSMTTIGILNIIFGSLGTLICLLMVVGGGLLAVGGAAMEAELGSEAEGLGTAAATGGGIVIALGLGGAAAWMLMFIGGIGVLKLASWGRTLSIVGSAVLGLLTVVSLVTGGFSFTSLLLLGYCATVVALCFSEQWKATFAGEGAPINALDAGQEFRNAA